MLELFRSRWLRCRLIRNRSKIDDLLTKRGYAGVTADDIFHDVLLPESKFHAAALLEGAFPAFARSNRTFLPVFRYLNAAGIADVDSLNASGYVGAKKVVGKMSGQDYFFSKDYRRRFDANFKGLSTSDIVKKASNAKEALLMLPFQPDKDVDTDRLREFLEANAAEFSNNSYITPYRKLICRYDKLTFGF